MTNNLEPNFLTVLKDLGIKHLVGVPDSSLKQFLEDFLAKNPSIRNIVAVNEGQALAIANGIYLGSGTVTPIYLQNSGIGNLLNPYVSINQKKVFNIPALFIIGWRGYTKNTDEPQHQFQGEITMKLLRLLKIKFLVIDKKNIKHQKITNFIKKNIEKKISCALVISPDYNLKTKEKRENLPLIKTDKFLNRKTVVLNILKNLDHKDILLASTGYISRETMTLYDELKLNNPFFPNIGAMGHIGSIGIGLSLTKTNKRIIIIDGDGSLLMHLGSITLAGHLKLKNFFHFILSNGVHESVGGQPISNPNINYQSLFSSVGYSKVILIENKIELDMVLESRFETNGPIAIVIKIQNSLGKVPPRSARKPFEWLETFVKSDLEI